MTSLDDEPATVLQPPTPPLAGMAGRLLRARPVDWPVDWPASAEPALWLAATLLLLVVTMTVLTDWNRAAAIHNAAAAGAPTAASDGMWLESEIDKERLVPYILANDPDVAAALSPATETPASLALARAALNRKLEMLCDGTAAGVIYVLDSQGMSVASSNWNKKDSFVGVNFAFRPYFKQAQQDGSAAYFASGMVSHLPGLFIAHRVIVDGQFVGVVVVKVQFEALEARWAQLGGEVMVAERHGIVLLTDVPPWRFQTLNDLPDAQRDQLRRSGQYGDAPLTSLFCTTLSNGAVKVGGATEVSVKAAIPTTDWTLYLLLPIGSALLAADRSSVGVAVLVTALLIGVALTVRGWIKNYREMSTRNEEIRRQAVTDSLTQLPNRRAFAATLERQWRYCGNARLPLAAAMIDVDHFKAYNDFYGHQAGDECLRLIAQVLRESATRPEDMAARYGGEEFVLLLPGTDLAGVQVVAEALRNRLRRLEMAHITSPNGAVVTVSVGVASLVPADETGAASLIASADKALYQAKRAGRDQVVGAA
jgi:diguanylate cyclase (GGDEF)-like protein